MSESALIAYENPDGTCDLYWSHNGADEFYLKPYLEDVAAGDRPRTLPDVDPKYPDGTKEAGLEVADTLKTAVVPEPEHRHVPKRQVGNLIDFLAYEGFYYVTDNGVDLYYPVWTFPGVLVALREMIDLEVYPRDAFDATEGAVIDESSPVAALSEGDFSASTFEPVRYRSFIDLHHLGIFQTIAGVVNTRVS